MSKFTLRSAWTLIFILCAGLLLLAAWRPLAVPDEGRYGEIGRWMLSSGDWLTPRLNGIAFFHKPPLLYWLEAAALAVFGTHPWSARLVPALHAALMLASLYLAARHIAGETLARRAALMLGTSLAFLVGGQYVNHDMLVASWIAVTIWCFAAAFMHGERPDVRLALLGFAAAALGLLSKGLIGLALPGLVLLIWLAWTRQLRKILRLPWLRGLAILALLALPWFVLAQAQFADMLGYMFGKHQFDRYTGTTFNNGRPWWFYLPCLVLLMFPWVLFIRPLRARRPDTGPADSAPNAAWLSLLWIWLLAIVGFFSIPNSKLVGYVLPVMPPLALLAALGWGQWMRNKPGQAPKLLHALALLAVLGAVVVTGVAGRYSDKKGTADIARTLACQASVGDTVYAVGDYPYDLPFYTGASRPMVVIQDWAEQRRSAGDNWRRELFEGANIDPLAGQVLQGPEALAPASQRPGNWLVMPRGTAPEQRPGQWVEVQQGQAWTLLRSDPVESGGGAAGKGPEATEHKGLPGCKHQGNDQRQH